MIRIRQLEIDGFRGYPRKRTLSFPQIDGGSLLIFARNGFGKTSITDALEFVLSKEGTLERLGVRRAELNAGRGPLRNTQISADAVPSVRLVFYDNKNKHDVTRAVELDAPQPMSPELLSLTRRRVVPFIIRGSELRAFVETLTPLSHYQFVAQCLGAERLIDLQSRIRSLQTQLRKTAEDNTELRRADSALKIITGAAVKRWDLDKVLAWLEARLKAIGLPAARSLTDTDPAILELAERVANEASTVQRAPFEVASTKLAALLSSKDDGPLRKPIFDLRAANAHLVKLTAATARAESKGVIDEAVSLLTKRTEVSECPVCETPFEKSPHRTREAVVERLKSLQQDLKEVAAAERASKKANEALLNQLAEVRGIISTAATVLSIDAKALLEHWARVHAALLLNDDSGIPDFLKAATKVKNALDTRIAQMAPGTPRIYGPVMETVRGLKDIEKRVADANSRHRQCAAMGAQVSNARGLIDKRVHGFFEGVVQSISDATVSFYNKVQACAPFPVGVKVQLMDDENQDARGIEVLVDFPNAPNEKPRAILSDSQIHTLALGMQIAIIRGFNKGLPFIVLDDVVTSYDADYRRQIAMAITDDLSSLQLLVLTHDDQFFQIMKSRLADFDAARWRAHRILKYSLSEGPTFSDARTPESEVENYIRDGEPSGNAIRQHVEEWLIQISRGIGATYPMRAAEKPYDYSHRELVEGVIIAASHFGLEDAMEADKSLASFVSELKAAVIENEGSHAHDNPYRKGSVGDDISFWRDFKKFKALFECADTKCKGKKFRYDPAIQQACCEKCGKHLSMKP